MGQCLPSKCMAFGWVRVMAGRHATSAFADASGGLRPSLMTPSASAQGYGGTSSYALPHVHQRLIPALILFATLLFVVQEPLQQMNGLKNLLAVAINGIAIVYLAFTDLILWENALLMAGGAIVGALIGAGTARRVGQAAVRYMVVSVGVAMAVSMFLRP